MNRRSHGKIMVVDGHYPEKAFVMTGGRNISLDYYGLMEDGSIDPTSFKDLEVLLKVGADHQNEPVTVGSGAETYTTVLYLNPGNKFLTSWFTYGSQAEDAQQALAKLRGFENIKRHYAEMASFMVDGFSASEEVELPKVAGFIGRGKPTTDCVIPVSSGKFNNSAINLGVGKSNGQATYAKSGSWLLAVWRYHI